MKQLNTQRRYNNADKALSTLIAKYKKNNFNFEMYTHLFDTCVIPVMHYVATINSQNVTSFNIESYVFPQGT